MKDKIKRYGKVPAIISAVLSAIVCIWSFYFYMSTQTNIFLALLSSSVVFVISFFYCFVVVGIVWAIICAIRHIKRKNKVPPPNPQTEEYLKSVKPLSEPSFSSDNDVAEKPTPSTRASDPIYKVSITYDREPSDTGRECLIEKSPFVQPNAKRLKAIKSYIVVDTETTGLSYNHDKIVEISLARYTDGERTDHYTTLINPHRHIPDAATAINHIEDDDVVDAPSFVKAWPQISRFFDGTVIVGHNVKFDLNMIGYNMPRRAAHLDVSYLDTAQLAKDAFPGQPNYKLATLIDSLGISDSQEHRADSDVELTAQLFERCRATIINRYERELRERREQKAKAKAERKENFGWSSLLERNFVFTGEFSRDREKLESALASLGASCRDKVNGNTDYLVVGELKNLPQWALERKYLKAKQLQDIGKKVKLITEEEYISLLQEAVASKQI